MRRTALLTVLAGLVALGGGWLALASGKEQPRTRPAAATPSADLAPAAELPPLPDMRPQVVEPEAGRIAAEEDVPIEDPGLTTPGPRPARAASSSGRRGGIANAPGGNSDINRATALSNGVALPPLEAPEAVKQIIEAGNSIARAPYKWGGGHGRWQDNGYDCSGSVSFALAAAGLLNSPLASGPLMGWGKPGPGRWVTIYTNPGHVYMEVAGIRFDTSGQRVTGSRWQNDLRSHAGYTARHPEGL